VFVLKKNHLAVFLQVPAYLFIYLNLEFGCIDLFFSVIFRVSCFDYIIFWSGYTSKDTSNNLTN